MSERPDFLNQPATLKQRDRELQKQRRVEELGEQAALELLPLADIERSISETEKQLQALGDGQAEDRTALKERLSSLHSERERQAGLRASLLTGKDSRRRDFIERSIAETEKRLRQKRISGREQLKGRLTFLREERARILS